MKKNFTFIVVICIHLNVACGQEGFSDCSGAIILCAKVDFVVNNLFGAGQEVEEIGFASCSNRLREKHSVWLKWEVEEPGLIEFTITPLNIKDDIDFILFRLEDNISNCSKKLEVRCMAAGENIGETNDRSEVCSGKTGLKENTLDTIESDGCTGNQDNFLSALNTKRGEKYILYINNYSSNNGFKLEWGGTATFNEYLRNEDVDIFTKYSKTVFYTEYNIHSSDLVNSDISYQRATIVINKKQKSLNSYIGCNRFIDTTITQNKNEGMEIINIFPNPASHSTNLTINSNINTFVNVGLYDVVGRLLCNNNYFLQKGIETIHLSTDNLIPGFYIVFIKTENRQFSKKLIVSH